VTAVVEPTLGLSFIINVDLCAITMIGLPHELIIHRLSVILMHCRTLPWYRCRYRTRFACFAGCCSGWRS